MKIITGSLPTAYALSPGESAIVFSNGVTLTLPGTAQFEQKSLRLSAEQVKFERAELLAFYDVPSDAVEELEPDWYDRPCHRFTWWEVTL